MEAPVDGENAGVASAPSGDGITDSSKAEPLAKKALEVGLRMRCVGLVSCAEMNGTYCTLQSFNAETGRWTAKLEADGSCRHFKPANLEHPEETDVGQESDAPMRPAISSEIASTAAEEASVAATETALADKSVASDEPASTTAEAVSAVLPESTPPPEKSVVEGKPDTGESPSAADVDVQESKVVEGPPEPPEVAETPQEPVAMETSQEALATETVPEAVAMDTAPEAVAMDSAPEAVAKETPEAAPMDSAPEAVAMETLPETVDSASKSIDEAKGPVQPETVNESSSVSPVAETVQLPAPEKSSAMDTSGSASGATSPKRATVVVHDEEDLIDDIVPMVSYDHPRCCFSKDGRYILPKREQFPSIFCGLRVTLRLEVLPGAGERTPKELSRSEVEQMLCDDLNFGTTVAHWEDAPVASHSSPSGEGKSREIIAGLSAALPDGRDLNSKIELPNLGLSATIIGVTETSDDVDPERISALADVFREAGDKADAILFEFPVVWIIKDPDFKAKSASIGLYPGSYWMGFLKSWGAIAQAEIFFRTVQRESHESLLHLAVQFAQPASFKMCYTFLHNRYLAHPNLDNGVRPPWCRLINFQDFKEKACGTPKESVRKAVAKASAAKASIAKAAIAKAPIAKAAKSSAVGPKAVTKAKAPRTLAPAAPGTAAEAAAVAAAAAAALKARAKKANAAWEPAPMTPLPKATSSTSPRLQPTKVGTAPATPAPVFGADGPLPSPAEVMEGLSGRQLEVFKMVMSRMERLEKENQELMQILLQMQGLLQQQQQRNKRLTQVAGLVSSGAADQENLQQVSAGVAGLLATAPQMRQAQPLGLAPNLQAPPLHPPPVTLPQKRKAETSENRDTSPGPDGEAAPWKAQRRRLKRPKGTGVTPAVAGLPPNGLAPAMLGPSSAGVAPVVAAPPGSVSPTKASESGLAAHYNALLGV